MKLSRLILPAGALTLLAFSANHMLAAAEQKPRPDALDRPAQGNDGAIAGTGLVEPAGESVQIGAHRSGVISSIDVATGDRVAAGKRLFCVDQRSSLAGVEVRQSELQLESAELARLEKLPRRAAIEPLRGKLAASEARLKQVDDAARRTTALVEQKAAPAADRVSAEQLLAEVVGTRDAARADLALAEEGTWKPDINVARARVARAEALLAQAQAEVELDCVNAPFDATVLKVAVRQGEYIGPAVMGLVLGRVAPLQVRAEFDEVDIPRWSTGGAATAALRGQGEHPMPLTLVRVEPLVSAKKAFSGASSERLDTRVLQVVYALPADAPNVHVGQQVDVFVSAK